MAQVERWVDVTPTRVFEVLSDGWLYPLWVVGTTHMRAVEPSWPKVGSLLHHAVGAWPAMLRDESEVLVCEPDRRLVLEARGRPLGTARVELRLTPERGGTRIVLAEEPSSGPGKWAHNPVLEWVLTQRLTESIGRLAALVERPG